MARLPLVKHILTVGDVAGIGGDKYSFQAPDIYGNFNGVTGVVKAPNPDNTEYKGKLTNEDFATGQCIKLKCRAKSSNLVGQTTTRDFIVVAAFEKAKNSIANLDSKTITTGGIAGVGSTTWDIATVRIPRRRRFS